VIPFEGSKALWLKSSFCSLGSGIPLVLLALGEAQEGAGSFAKPILTSTSAAQHGGSNRDVITKSRLGNPLADFRFTRESGQIADVSGVRVVPILLQKSPRQDCRIETCNNRIGGNGFLNNVACQQLVLNQYFSLGGQKHFLQQNLPTAVAVYPTYLRSSRGTFQSVGNLTCWSLSYGCVSLALWSERPIWSGPTDI
jgi:hypothetical protein